MSKHPNSACFPTLEYEVTTAGINPMETMSAKGIESTPD